MTQQNDDANLTRRDQIDAICDQFEAAWQAGQTPQLQQVINAADAALHDELLSELLPLEIHYRKQRGESPHASDYLERFPSLRELIERLFASPPVDAGEAGPPSGELRTQLHASSTTPPLSADDATLPPQKTAQHDGATLPLGEAPQPAESPGDAWQIGSKIRYFGDYELLDEIARGGMGVVYRARQASLNRIVALKMILSGQLAGEEEVQRFHAEAEAAANLDHPGIVPIYEVGDHDGQQYFSMGFVDGASLSEKINAGPLPPPEAARLLAKTARAIAYAHGEGVIHRDLKPANVLLDKNNEPRVTDFGLAKKIEGDDQLTATGQILGTPSYMPPEQASGKIDQIDERSDVYSMGGILYALITGRPPFQAASHLDTLMQVLEKEPVPPRQLDPKLPQDLETIALKGLEKDPRRRYQSADELADDLDRFLKGEPILARSITPIERVFRWAKRKPIVAGLGSLAGGLLLLVAIGGPIAAFRQASLRSLAEARESEATQAKTNAEKAADMAKAARNEAVTAKNEAVSAKNDAEAARNEAVTAKNALARQKDRAERTLYARTVSLAYQEWLANNVSRADDLLNKTDHRFRDWEWHFVKKLCNSEQQTLHGHTGIPFRMRLSADGQRLVSIGQFSSVSVDSNTYVWDLATGNVVKRHPYRAFAIAPDARRVALEMVSDGPVIIFDVLTEEKVAQFPAHAGGTAWANFNSDGSQLVTTGPDQTVRIWDIASGAKVLEIPVAARRRVAEVKFSADDRLLVWKTYTGLIQIYDAATGKKRKEIQDPIYRVDAVRVAISPDNTILAAASDGPINLFDLSSGKLIDALHGHSSSVLGLAFSPDGKRLASSGVDGTVRVWDMAERRESFRYRGHKFGVVYGVFEVIYSDDGKWIISGGADRTIKIWPADAEDGFPPDTASPDNGNINATQTASVYPDPSQEKDWLVGNQNYVDAVAFSADGSWVATASEDKTVKLYDVKSRKLISNFRQHTRNVGALAIHPGGQLIASGEGGLNDQKSGAILIWDRASGEVLQTLKGHSGPISTLKFSPDGQRLYSSMGSQAIRHRGEVIAWDVKTGELVYKNDAIVGVRRIDLSPDGRQIAVATFAGPLSLLNSDTGKLERKLGGAGENHWTVDFSPDGKRLAAGKINWAVSVYDVESGRRLWEQIEHSGAVLGIAFNPSGSRIVSASVDRTMKMWDAQSGDMLINLQGDAFELFDVTISPDGNTLASYGEAPYVTLRDLGGADDQPSSLTGSSQWPVIFSDDFERQELGDQWTVTNGSWEIERGAAKGTLAPLPSVPGFVSTTIVPKSWLPSIVEIEFEAWSPQRLLFETKLQNETAKSGIGSLFIAGNTPFNQGRRGAAIFVQASGGFSEVARIAKPAWFKPNRKYKLKSIRNRDRWEMFIDGQPVLSTNVPAGLWVPVLHLQASFGQPGQTLFIDNLVVRAPPETADEIAATGLEYLLRQDLKLKALVVDSLRSDTEISDEVRRLAVGFANSKPEDAASRKKIAQQELLAAARDGSTYRALAKVLEEDVARASDDWEARQLLAGAYYRAGDLPAAVNALREAEATYQKIHGMSHPMHMAVLAMTSVDLKRPDRAAVAMSRLTELMRSDYWQSNQQAVAWQQLALEKVKLPDPTDAALASEIEAIKRLTFEPQQRALLKYDIDDYLATFTPDAKHIAGRSATPSQYDVQVNIADWKRAERVFSQGAPSIHAFLVRSRADVTIQGNEATLQGTYTAGERVVTWSWESEEKLRKTEDGWKITYRRQGLTGLRMATTRIDSDQDWAQQDARVEAVRKTGDDRKLLPQLVFAFHRQESFDLIRRLAERPGAPAELWDGLADRAYSISDADEMLRAARKAVELNPAIGGHSFVRAIAVRENLPEAALDVGHGIRVRAPEFFQLAPKQGFDVPGQVLRAWLPTNTSAIVLSYGENLMQDETLEQGMVGMANQYQAAYRVKVYRQQIIELHGLETADLIIEGFGGGRRLMYSLESNTGTVRRWVVMRRGKSLVSFLLTAASHEFDLRNAEFQTLLDLVEIDQEIVEP